MTSRKVFFARFVMFQMEGEMRFVSDASMTIKRFLFGVLFRSSLVVRRRKFLPVHHFEVTSMCYLSGTLVPANPSYYSTFTRLLPGAFTPVDEEVQQLG